MKRSVLTLRVPPPPQVMAQLYADFRRDTKDTKDKKISFLDYLKIIGFIDRGTSLPGRDSGQQLGVENAALVQVPNNPVTGTLRLIVLLVDFDDKVATRPRHEFEDMLFSQNTYLTGSMREFYGEVSKGQVDVVGSVHGWLRMPQSYSYYVNNHSGTGSYPHNAQRLAEHALAAAIHEQVPFPDELDKFGTGSITGLFIVHAGPGAEVMTSVQQQKQFIWSHKADMQMPVNVAPGLAATNYLTVPEDCRMGVCAHELGHLAFQWDDFYDPNYDEDGSEWDGAGNWDLMAGGSWNNGGNTPAHPAGLHKSQHGWIEVDKINQSKHGVIIKPYSSTEPSIVRVKGPNFNSKQALILENRVQEGFDSKLPGAGLLVWRVNTDLEQFTPDEPAMLLIQADGRHDLEEPGDFNVGDTGDPFPGSKNVTVLEDHGLISTSFPGGPASQIRLSNIRVNQGNEVTLDIDIG